MRWFAGLFLLLAITPCRAEVRIVRVPDGGIEPRAAVDGKGQLHLIYFKGDPAHGNLYYAHSGDGGTTFNKPVPINSQPGSAMAVGGVRGAQLAIGKDHRLHVAWMGSATGEPKAAGNATPLLYTRSDDHGGFEPQRNVIAVHTGMDGGGSIGADGRGNVYIAWHAPEKPGTGEATRRVWIAQSTDDGKTFAPEFPVTDAAAGACGCCSLGLAVAADGQLAALYRTAGEGMNRDSTFVRIADHAGKSLKLAPMKVNQCIMSTYDLLPLANGSWAAGYETRGDLFVQHIVQKGEALKAETPIAIGHGKYPAVAVNSRSEMLVADITGASWGKGGSLAWRVFDAHGKPIDTQSGTARDGLTWNYPAAVALPNDDFLIVH